MSARCGAAWSGLARRRRRRRRASSGTATTPLVDEAASKRLPAKVEAVSGSPRSLAPCNDGDDDDDDGDGGGGDGGGGGSGGGVGGGGGSSAAATLATTTSRWPREGVPRRCHRPGPKSMPQRGV